MRWSRYTSGRRSGCGERSEDVGGLVAEESVGGGNVGVPAETDDVDRGVTQGGHDLWPGAGAHAGVVLTEGWAGPARGSLGQVEHPPVGSLADSGHRTL